jgi:hypothetical protein
MELQHKYAQVLEQQNALLGELHSAYSQQAKMASALCQAVKLANDGVIDVSDILSTANRLIADGSVKLSAVDSVFTETPGSVMKTEAEVAKLDPLTSYLRSTH